MHPERKTAILRNLRSEEKKGLPQLTSCPVGYLFHLVNCLKALFETPQLVSCCVRRRSALKIFIRLKLPIL